MFKAKQAVDAIVTQLAAIAIGDPAELSAGFSYTYQTDAGQVVTIDQSISDTETDTYPRCSVFVSQAFAAGGAGTQSVSERPLIAIEAADKLDGRDRLTVAGMLLDDIKAAVKPAEPSAHHDKIRPRQSGVLWEILNRKPGSDLVIVRRWYESGYVDHYPPDD